MTRYDGDSWGPASSVGMTATLVAAARAMGTKDERGLIDDPFAEPLVRAVGIPFFVDLLDGRIDPAALGDDGPERAAAMVAGMAMRTRFFDEYFATATGTGIRQAVILAAGLDSRAYRLPWPTGTVVYEVDQPAVVEFKTDTLAGLGAVPAATRRTVSIDLREDWPSALRASGFDPAARTAWLAEGLLIYLPPEAQDRLLDTITELSAPGSTVATEYVPGIVDFDADRAREMTAPMQQQGLDLDMPALIYPGPRSNVMDHLSATGWQVTGVPEPELFARAGLPPRERGDHDPLGEITYVSATR
ncbi:MAG: class I SAM-dependent methyltransferase [Mycobacterium sp.]|nr:class I SAM-dependent methyltransferase [Mycobacterium sp.]